MLSESTAEDTALTLDLLAQASDVEGSTLTVNIVTGPAHGTLVENADGSFTYTPHADYNGGDSFTYRVNDGELDSALATVSLTVTPVNDAPVAGDASINTQEDQILTGNLLSYGIDVDGDSLSAVVVNAPAHGTLVLHADGSFTYTPHADYNGSDSFTYRLSDGTLDSNLATVTLTVAAVNDAPVAYALISGPVPEDGVLQINLLSNTTDVDGDTLTAHIAAAPQHGHLTVNADGSVSYRTCSVLI